MPPRQEARSNAGLGTFHQRASLTGVKNCKAGNVQGGLLCTRNAKGKTLNADPSGHGRIDDSAARKTDQWLQRKMSADITGKPEACKFTLVKSKFVHN